MKNSPYLKSYFFFFSVIALWTNSTQAAGEILRNADGSIKLMNHYEAMKACPPGTRLPSIRELAREGQSRGSEGIVEWAWQIPKISKRQFYKISAIDPNGRRDEFYFNYMEAGNGRRNEGLENLKSYWFWSSSISTDDSNYAYDYQGSSGGLGRFNRSQTKDAVICIRTSSGPIFPPGRPEDARRNGKYTGIENQPIQTNPDLSSVTNVIQSIFNPAFAGQAARFVGIKTPAIFKMGCNEIEACHYPPWGMVTVKLTKPFEIQTTPVTQLQWYLVMKDTNLATPSYYKNREDCSEGNFIEVNFVDTTRSSICKNHPVESVSWEQVQIFISMLNQLQNSYTYRLPTAAEWEYVAKSGFPSENPFGWATSFFDGILELDRYAWYEDNSWNYTSRHMGTREVATKLGIPTPSNSNDLMYDMAGNVSQFVSDWYGERWGLTGAELREGVEDPTGPQFSDIGHVKKSAGFNENGMKFFTGIQRWGGRQIANGFRLVRTLRTQ